MKVKRNTLLLLACLVWSAAGFNILRIGLMAYPAYLTPCGRHPVGQQEVHEYEAPGDCL